MGWARRSTANPTRHHNNREGLVASQGPRRHARNAPTSHESPLDSNYRVFSRTDGLLGETRPASTHMSQQRIHLGRHSQMTSEVPPSGLLAVPPHPPIDRRKEGITVGNSAPGPTHPISGLGIPTPGGQTGMALS
jgi:hypothetical protein